MGTSRQETNGLRLSRWVFSQASASITGRCAALLERKVSASRINGNIRR